MDETRLAKAKRNLSKLCKLRDLSGLSSEEIEEMKADCIVMAESGMSDDEIRAFFEKA